MTEYIDQREGRDAEIADIAADWFLRIHNDELSETDLLLWHDWISADPAHAEAFDGVAAVWEDCGRLEPAENAINSVTARDGGRRRWALGLMGVAAGLALIVLAGVQQIQPSHDTAPRATFYETGIAEHRTVALADGSTIHLGAGSKLVTRYGEAARNVTLERGEAYFSVAKDQNRPFIVLASGRTVRAVGTAFNINIRAEDVTVDVVEGHVRIATLPAQGPPVNGVAVEALSWATDLFEGQSVRYGGTGEIDQVTVANVNLMGAWQQGKLSFVDTPLRAVIADVNRYSLTEIVVIDESVGDLTFTGTVFQNDIETWLVGLQKAFPIRTVRLEERDMLVIAKAEN